MQSLRNATVVVTGASSGIGRATALAFARRGARIALCARREGPLREAAEACNAVGGRAVAIPTDVTDAGSVRDLARTAAETYGSIAVWVNNAGVGAVGRYTDTPVEAHRRVVETNLLGYMYGAHAALPYFLEQGYGVLINNISLGAWLPAPYAAAYAASKWGLRGFSESLAAELVGCPDIQVCDVFPSFMNTPGIGHGANYTGHALRPVPPVYDPQRVAEAIVGLALRPKRTVPVGAPAALARLAGTLAPRLTGRMTMRVMRRALGYAAPAPRTSGNLFQPMSEGTTTHGGWQSENRALLLAALAVAGIATAAILLPASSRSPRRG